MFFDENITVTEIFVFRPDFIKKRSICVPGRPYHALTFRLSGSVKIEDGKKSLISKAGAITFVPKGQSYDTEIIENGSMYAVHFKTMEERKDIPFEVITPSYHVVFNNMFSELASRYNLGRENDLYCMSIFYGILAETRHEIKRIRGTGIIDPRMRYAKEHIDRGFSDPALSVSSLAAEAGISEVYFRRKFGDIYGTAPNAYIKKIRIENAKALLRTGYYTITETATRCGFDSISYFSCEFHRIVGKTPREYAEDYCRQL